MSPLPTSLRRPQPWLAGLALMAAAALADSFRRPEDQWTARGYRTAVEGYQWAKPRCGLKGCCRFSPSCSSYSSEAVARFGVWRGLSMSLDRISRCQTTVPAGTRDPLPEKAEEQGGVSGKKK